MTEEPVLAGQTAIVTGGGRGVGRAIATALALAGASVAVLGRTRREVIATAKELTSGNGRRAIDLVCDVLDADALAAAIVHCEHELGPVSLLVNNAGTGEAVGPVVDVDPGSWWRDVEVVLRGAFLSTRAVLPRMLARKSGRIINVSSRTGGLPTAYHSGYSCSRAAVFAFTEALAKEVEGETGVSVFALTPGMMRTAMTEHIAQSVEGRRWLPGFAELLAKDGACADPAALAPAVVALASGRLDALSGRWLHAGDDLARFEREAAAIRDEDRRVLRLRQ